MDKDKYVPQRWWKYLYEYLIDGVPCKSTNFIIVISIIY